MLQRWPHVWSEHATSGAHHALWSCECLASLWSSKVWNATCAVYMVTQSCLRIWRSGCTPCSLPIWRCRIVHKRSMHVPQPPLQDPFSAAFGCHPAGPAAVHGCMHGPTGPTRQGAQLQPHT